MAIDRGSLNVDPGVFGFRNGLEKSDPGYAEFVEMQLESLLEAYLVFFNAELGINTQPAQQVSLPNLIRTFYATAEIHHGDPYRRNSDEPFFAHVVRTAIHNIESYYLVGSVSNDPLEEILRKKLMNAEFATSYWSTAFFSPFPPLLHDSIENKMEKSGKRMRESAPEVLRTLEAYEVNKRAISMIKPGLMAITRDPLDEPYRNYLAGIVANPRNLGPEGLFVCGMNIGTKSNDGNDNTDMKRREPVWRRLRRAMKNLEILNLAKEWMMDYRQVVGDNIAPWYVPDAKDNMALAIRSQEECTRIGNECRETIDRIIDERLASYSPSIGNGGNGSPGLTELEQAVVRRGQNLFGAIDYVLDSYIHDTTESERAEEPVSREKHSAIWNALILPDSTSYHPALWHPIFSGTLLTHAREVDITSEQLAVRYSNPGSIDDQILYAYTTYAQAKLIGKLCTRIAEHDSDFFVKNLNAPIPDKLQA
ncbi:MAG: hypothetical protein EPN86_06555 [Nanoarchaeota archaeon]|nr:MAG: hypothetical protein EPN86_06555 [Nanoarchaeota archaeon]